MNMDVNHKNMKKDDNDATNIEYMTRTENAIHGRVTSGRARKVEKYSLQGELLETYGCTAIAARENGIKRFTLKNRIGKCVCHGFVFKFSGVGEDIQTILAKIRASNVNRPVTQYNLEMEPVFDHKNVYQASKKTGISHRILYAHMKNGKNPCMKKYYFKYAQVNM